MSKGRKTVEAAKASHGIPAEAGELNPLHARQAGAAAPVTPISLSTAETTIVTIRRITAALAVGHNAKGNPIPRRKGEKGGVDATTATSAGDARRDTDAGHVSVPVFLAGIPIPAVFPVSTRKSQIKSRRNRRTRSIRRRSHRPRRKYGPYGGGLSYRKLRTPHSAYRACSTC